eukprot:1160218-Pelagomonas_calceolata.AAC.10
MAKCFRKRKYFKDIDGCLKTGIAVVCQPNGNIRFLGSRRGLRCLAEPKANKEGKDGGTF